MVRLYSISVYYKTEPAKALEKKAAYELSSFGFFNRSRSVWVVSALQLECFHSSYYSVREFMSFTSEVLAQRTSSGERRTVKEQGIVLVDVYSLVSHAPTPTQSTDVPCMYAQTVWYVLQEQMMTTHPEWSSHS